MEAISSKPQLWPDGAVNGMERVLSSMENETNTWPMNWWWPLFSKSKHSMRNCWSMRPNASCVTDIVIGANDGLSESVMTSVCVTRRHCDVGCCGAGVFAPEL